MIHWPSIHPAHCRTTIALALATLVVAASAPGASAASAAADTRTFAPVPARLIGSGGELTNKAGTGLLTPHAVANTGGLPVDQGGTSVRGFPSTLNGGTVGAVTAATPIDLYPTLTLNSFNHYAHTSNDSWCAFNLQTVGLAGDFDVSALDRAGKLAAGYGDYYDPGSGLFPCDAQSATYYRGGVGFDMTALSKYVGANGLKSVYLEFRLDTGNGSCIDHIGVNSDPWEHLAGSSGDLPDGGVALHPHIITLSGGGLAGELEVTAPIALSMAFGGGAANPHLHFVFVGPVENINAQDNNIARRSSATHSSWWLRKAERPGAPRIQRRRA
jgi:hypothetical protein